MTLESGTTTLSHILWICRTCDYISLNSHYCVLFSSRVRVRIIFSVWLVSGHVHVFVPLLSHSQQI